MSFVAKTATVDNRSDVYRSARVENFATLENSVIYGNVQISDTTTVTDCMIISAAPDSEAGIRVYGNASLSEIVVRGTCHIYGDANLENNLDNNSWNITLEGNCKFGGNATFDGLYFPNEFVEKYGEDKVHLVDSKVILTDVWDMG